MAIGKSSDFKIYHEYFDAGFTEVIADNLEAFNSSSNNALALRSQLRKGDYSYSSFFQEISGLDSRRDTTSTSSVTSTAMTQEELVSVKVNRRQGPVEQTIDSFRKKQMSLETFSFVIGQQAALKQLSVFLNIALTSVVAALNNTSDLVHDATDGTIQAADFTYGFQKLKDKLNGVQCMVMHYKPFYDMWRDQLSNFVIDEVAGALLVQGSAATFGKRVIVLSDDALVNTDGITSGTDSYYTLLLQEGAAVIEESEPSTLHQETKGGLENLTLLWQFEYAFNVSLRGYTWDVANGGSNPTVSALGTGSNWDKAYADIRNLGGAIIESQ